MTIQKTIYTAGLAIALLSFSINYQQARAIEGESIVLSPASTKIEVDAGATIKDTLKVINDGTVSYDFIVYSTPYSVQNGDYTPNYDDKKANADLYTWVTYDKQEYTLNPGETVDIPYTITVPNDASPGGHYSVLFAETQTDEGSGQITRKKRVGTIVYATVKGDYITAGKQLSAKIDWLQLGGPITASLAVENTGNSDFTMTEYMQVKNVLGGKAYEKTSDRIILPKTTRDTNLAWTDGPIMGLYNVKIESKVLGKVATTSSWVLLMPAWLLAVSVLAIIGIIYWRLRLRRR